MASRSQPECAATPATSGAEPSAAFTPGPWEVWDIATLRVVNRRIGWTIYTIEDPGPPEKATHLANARLIAAAPDLLEASVPSDLEDAADIVERENSFLAGELRKQAKKQRAAIAKALGTSETQS